MAGSSLKAGPVFGAFFGFSEQNKQCVDHSGYPENVNRIELNWASEDD